MSSTDLDTEKETPLKIKKNFDRKSILSIGLMILWLVNAIALQSDPIQEFIVLGLLFVSTSSLILGVIKRKYVMMTPSKNSPFANAGISVFLSGVLLSNIALGKELVSESHLLPLLLGYSFFLTFLFLVIDAEVFAKKSPHSMAKKVFIAVAHFTFAIMLAFGSLIAINTQFDKNPPQWFHTKVLGKECFDGRNSFYRIQVTPWGERTQEESVSIPREICPTVKIDDTARIAVKPGLLNIPWISEVQVGK